MKSKSKTSYVASGVNDQPDEAWDKKGDKPELPEGLRRERKGPLPKKTDPSEKS